MPLPMDDDEGGAINSPVTKNVNVKVEEDIDMNINEVETQQIMKTTLDALTCAVDHLTECIKSHVMQGMTIEKLLSTYAKDWMQPYKELQYIYIPIEEQYGHWYLAVISVEEQVIYQFDTHIQMEVWETRRETIKNLCEVIAQMVGSQFYLRSYFNEIVMKAPSSGKAEFFYRHLMSYGLR